MSHRVIAGKPLHSKGWPMVAYDLETSGLNATKPIFGCTKRIDTGSERTFSSMRKLREYLESLAPCIAYAHRGSSFDMFGILTAEEVYNARKVTADTRIFEIEINGVRYRDSKQLIPISIAQLGDSLGMEKGITPQVYIDGSIESFAEVIQEHIEYCLMDVRILAAGIIRLREIYAEIVGWPDPLTLDVPLTIASLSYRAWCSTSWPDNWTWTDSKKRVRKMGIGKKHFNDLFREAEIGGRVQVFGEPGEMRREVISYDANSLYPSQMVAEGNLFPDVTSCRHIGPTLPALISCINAEGVVTLADITVQRPDGVAGMLPALDEEGRRAWAVNRYSGYLCEPEIRLMMELGYEISEVRDIVIARGIRPFDDYINRLYGMRIEMQKKGDPSQKLIKLAMNALYGGYGIKEKPARIEGFEAIKKCEEREDYLERYELRYYDGTGLQWPYLLDYSAMSRAPSRQWFGFSSFILSYARVALMRGILAAGEHICYVDTDSVHLTKEGAESFVNEIPIGDSLGEWKLETPEPIPIARYWEPKMYSHYDAKGRLLQVKHKGVRVRGDDGEFLPQAGDPTKVQISRSVVTLYEGLRRGLTPGTELITEKRSRRFYRG